MMRSTELVIKLFAKKVEEYFSPILIGKDIHIIGDIKLDFYEKTYVAIDHFGYIIKYYNPRKKENGLDLKNYFEQKIKNQKIKKIQFDSTFLIDEVFIVCTLENGATVELAMGYCASMDEFHRNLDVLLSEEEKNYFSLLTSIYISVARVEREKKITFEARSDIYESVVKTLNLENKFEFQLSDFYKLEKINKLFKPDHIDAVETVAAIERIIYE